MVGNIPLKDGILVRIQVPEHAYAKSSYNIKSTLELWINNMNML